MSDLRDRLKNGRPLLTGWASLGSPLAIELMGRAGFDLVTIDQQHGIGGPAELLAQLTAARAAGLPALVRVSAMRRVSSGAPSTLAPRASSVP